MDVLDVQEIICCPVCHGQIDLEEIRDNGNGSCNKCKRVYSFQDNAYNLIPNPLPQEIDSSFFSKWENLQKNGLISYIEDPINNLSVGEREDALKFSEFLRIDGLTLDVGSGPQPIPVYAQDFYKSFIGIDPINIGNKKEYFFIQSLGEFLPFYDNSFNHVLFATSLDHMLDPLVALKESHRVLNYGGDINIWFYYYEQSIFEKIRNVLSKIKKFFNNLIFNNSLRQQNKNTEKSKVPEYFQKLEKVNGAADFFHHKHLDFKEIMDMISAANFEIVDYKKYKNVHHFVKAKKNK